MLTRTGVVYLVGAGPGDPGLLTRRGEALLRTADVVVYDRLISPDLLALCSPSAKLIYVGKEGGGPSFRQADINRLLVEHALAGRRVVRLKGGDPFVFGRGGEEALALRAAGVPFEVVPGVSSAIAAAAYAGIPVTHRGLASTVTFATGHEDLTKPGSDLDWEGLARGADTLVFLMGVDQITSISRRLLAAGRSPDEPAALIRWGTTPAQQTWCATLGTIAGEARAQAIRPPAVLVIGPVVQLRDQLTWFENRPLFGRRILVTRAREQASALSRRLFELGAQAVEFPTIRIAALDDTRALDEALRSVGLVDWVVFTSTNGVRAVFERLGALDLDARAFGSALVAAIGPATASALEEHGIRPDFVPTAFTSEAIVEELSPEFRPGQSLVLFRADIAPVLLAKGLASRGIAVRNITAYRTVPDLERRAEVREMLDQGLLDAVTFTSSSTVRNLLQALDGETSSLNRILVACIGPVTASTARELGLRVDLVASVHTVDGLAQALRSSLGEPTLHPEVGS